MMPQKSPTKALRAAVEKRPTGPATNNDGTPALIEAIKNSTTRKDQIVLRRIGLLDEPPKDLT